MQPILVSTRYAAPGGALTHKLAKVLAGYPALNMLRVQILSTGEIRHINEASVAWAVYPQTDLAAEAQQGARQ